MSSKSRLTLLFTALLRLCSIVFVHGLRGHPSNSWSYGNKDDSRAGDGDGDHASRLKKQGLFSKLGSKLRSSKPGKEKNEPVLEGGEGGNGGSAVKAKTVFWPAEILPVELPNARIFTYGYNADLAGGIFQGNNKNSILQHGNDLMVKLERTLKDQVGSTFSNRHAKYTTSDYFNNYCSCQLSLLLIVLVALL